MKLFLAVAMAAEIFTLGSRSQASPMPGFNFSYSSVSDSVGFLSTPSFTLGYSFQTTSALRVSKLGVFDFEGNGLAESHDVGLFDDQGTRLASVTIGGGSGAETDGFLYASVSAITLSAGQNYFLGALYTSNKDEYVFNSTSITPSPLLTYLYGTATFGNVLTAPLDADPYGRSYFGPNLIVSAVPLPAGLPLFGVGLMGLGAMGYGLRRRARVATNA